MLGTPGWVMRQCSTFLTPGDRCSVGPRDNLPPRIGKLVFPSFSNFYLASKPFVVNEYKRKYSSMSFLVVFPPLQNKTDTVSKLLFRFGKRPK